MLAVGTLQRQKVVDGMTTMAVEAAPTDAAGQGSWDWLAHWYPVLPLEELESQPLRPQQVTLFGLDLVVWADGAGGAQCFSNVCPHRLAPLSEGTVVDGTLECSYHVGRQEGRGQRGWRFAGSGRCVGIPQLAGTPAEATACSNKRSCATAYPTRQHAGLLWVWPDASPAGHAAAKLAELPIPPEVVESLSPPAAGPRERGTQAGPVNTTRGWVVRDIPYSFDFLLENVLDPSHILFAHHGVLGRREDAVPFSVTFKEPVSLERGLRLGLGTHSRKVDVQDRTLTLEPPCFTQNIVVRKDGTVVAICGYAVPSRPGHSRFITTSYLVTSSGAARAALALAPRPLLHSVLNEALDGDMLLVAAQESNLLKAGGDWRQKFFMPAPCDVPIVAYRKWWDLAGGAAGVPWAVDGTKFPARRGVANGDTHSGTETAAGHESKGSATAAAATAAAVAVREVELSGPAREQLFNRMRHIENCTSCRRALTTLEKAQRVGFGLAAALGLIAAGVGAGGPGAGPLAVAAALAALVAVAAGGLKGKLLGKDYLHFERR
ncbi:hypothetical protein N2152v2_006750 [Parachlorella kessleri]